MAGHVFMLPGDVQRLACDYRLTPGGASNGRSQAQTGAHAARGFLAEVRQRLTARLSDRHGRSVERAKPLVGLAVPSSLAPAELTELCGLAQQTVQTQDVDVALVAAPETLAALQAARDGQSFDSELDQELRQQGDEVAREVSQGRLALFLGAGVGASVGLPLWGQLLDRLAERAGMDPEAITALQELHHLDRAAILEKRLGGPTGLPKAVQENFERDHYSLLHGLLAALPVHEVVTTNYDRLFEFAWDALGHRYSVIPHHLLRSADRWLLKLHGCISHPEDIVLTREDLLGYEENRAALGGIVQALLVTRHMLFVGFSLSDDNFHRIAQAVRRILEVSAQCDETRPFGTALVLERSPLLEELWGPDLRWIGVGRKRNDEEGGTRNAARRLEVFVDYVLAQASLLSKPLRKSV